MLSLTWKVESGDSVVAMKGKRSLVNDSTIRMKISRSMDGCD